MIVECQSCGAPLNVPSASARYVECGYCHKTNRLRTMRTIQAQTPKDWRPPAAWTVDGRAQAYTKTTVKAVAGGVLLLIVVIVLGMIGFVVAMVVGLGAIGWGSYEAVRASEEASSPTWDGRTPFACTGHDEIELSGLSVNLPNDVAMTVTDHCRVTITGCSITARLPLFVDQHGAVIVHGGSLAGSPNAIEARGHASVAASGVSIVGQVVQDERASVAR